MKCTTEEVFRKKAIVWLWVTMLSLAVMILLLLCLISYKQQDFPPESQKVSKSSQEGKTNKKLPPDINNALGFEIIAVRKRNEDDQYSHVIVSVKITNISGKHIKNGDVTCVMQDDTGKNVAIVKEAVIFEIEGGLAQGRSIYHDFTLYTYPLNMSSAICNTDYVTYYEQ